MTVAIGDESRVGNSGQGNIKVAGASLTAQTGQAELITACIPKAATTGREFACHVEDRRPG